MWKEILKSEGLTTYVKEKLKSFERKYKKDEDPETLKALKFYEKLLKQIEDFEEGNKE